MKTTPDEITIACGWTRPRLSLYVGTGVEFSSEPSADRGELSREDRLRVEDHLDACSDCRRRRSALMRSTAALSAAAAESPVEPHAPSLWDGVAARIEAGEAAPPSPWTRLARSLTPASGRSVADRAARRLDRVRGGLPLQLAWMRDSIQHDLPDRLRAALLDRAAWSRASDRQVGRLVGRLTSPIGLGAAAAAAAFAIGLSATHRSETAAEARIAAASAPIPIELRAVPLVLAPARAEVPPVVEAAASHADDPESPSTELEVAQNSAPLQPPPAPAASQAAANAAKPAAPRRYDHDLEYGVPMPPDARIVKPAY